MEIYDGKRPLDERDQSSMGDQSRVRAASQEQVLRYLLNELLQENKRRRWGDWIFRGLIIGFFGLFALLSIIIVGMGAGIAGEEESFGNVDKSSKHTAVVEFEGVLESSLDNHKDVLTALKRAFKNKNSLGVILKVNSPGGSPVLADEMYQELRALRKKYPNKKLMIVTGDVCASGCYYLAVAGDKIFVNHSSIVGSIGVIHMSFGLQKLMGKIEIEPRIITAGERKAMLNPFEAIKPEDREYLHTLLKQIHARFIAVVKEGRGKRLASDNVFNGLFWTGEEAVKLGLADGISTVAKVAQEEIGEGKMVDYSVHKLDLEKLLTAQASTMIPTMIQHSALWLSQGKWQ